MEYLPEHVAWITNPLGWLILLCGGALLALRQLICSKTPALPVVRVVLPLWPRAGFDAREVTSSPSVLVAAELPSRAPPLVVALQVVRKLRISVRNRRISVRKRTG